VSTLEVEVAEVLLYKYQHKQRDDNLGNLTPDTNVKSEVGGKPWKQHNTSSIYIFERCYFMS